MPSTAPARPAASHPADTVFGPGPLHPNQVAAFQRQGYLLSGRPLLPDADFADLSTTFERLLAEWVAEGGRPEHMDVPHFRHPELMRWLMHKDVLDVVESLIGPDIALFSSHFICKPPTSGRRVPWHEDSAYWKGQWDPMEVVTIWLAIDPSTPSNGNMQVIPGSHSNGYSDYEAVTGDPEVFGTRIKPSNFDATKAIHCSLQPNEFSIHHAKMIHGSEPNTSSIRRCGYTMRYCSARARFNAQRNSNNGFQIYLARGQDHAGNMYADPTKPNQTWMDAYAPATAPKGH